MKLLQLDRKHLAAVGIEPLQPFEEKRPMIVLVKRFLVYISMNEYANSFYGFATMTAISSVFVIILWKINSLFELIGGLEKFIELRMENPQSKRTYVKLNENIEKWTDFSYFFLVQVTLSANMIPHFVISFFLYFTTDLGSEAFSFPIPIWAPFDWRTPIGYLFTFAVELQATFLSCHICAFYIATFAASCYVVFTFCNDIKNEIHVLDEGSKTEENSAELMKKVGDIVEFHAAAKQLVFDIDNVFALTIIVFFVWSLSTICSTLLMVQIQLEHNFNPLELIIPILTAFWSFAVLFLICEFGQMLTDYFIQLTDSIYDCDWTSFPKEIQKILPIIMQNTQQEVVLETFKNASCSRESFKMVVNKGFSYFMVFRKFR